MFDNWIKGRRKIKRLQLKLLKANQALGQARINNTSNKERITALKDVIKPIKDAYGSATKNEANDYYYPHWYRKEDEPTLFQRIGWHITIASKPLRSSLARMEAKNYQLEKEKEDLLKEIDKLSFNSALVKAIANGEKTYEA